MNKVISINIASTSFYIDEDAYSELQAYLQKLENWFSKKEGGQEIVADIESRLAELMAERISNKNSVVSKQIVTEVIQIMGQPEDFLAEDSESSEEKANNREKTSKEEKSNKRWFRDVDNKVLGGVCSGTAAYLNLDPVLVRIITVLIAFFSAGTVLLAYIIFWVAIPPALTTTDKMQMKGENITIKNIEKNIKEELNKVKREFSKSSAKMAKRDKNLLIGIAVLIILLLIPNFLALFLPFTINILQWPIILIPLLFLVFLAFKIPLRTSLIITAVAVLIYVIIKLILTITYTTIFYTL